MRHCIEAPCVDLKKEISLQATTLKINLTKKSITENE